MGNRHNRQLGGAPQRRSNGAGSPPPNAFQQLERLILSIGSARNKAEMMARVSGAIRLTKAIGEGLAAALKHSTYLTGLLVAQTGGRLVQLTIPADLTPSTIAKIGFADADGQALAMVDPARLFVLIEPKHAEPLWCNLTRKDGTEERHELPPLPSTPDVPGGEGDADPLPTILRPDGGPVE